MEIICASNIEIKAPFIKEKKIIFASWKERDEAKRDRISLNWNCQRN